MKIKNLSLMPLCIVLIALGILILTFEDPLMNNNTLKNLLGGISLLCGIIFFIIFQKI